MDSHVTRSADADMRALIMAGGDPVDRTLAQRLPAHHLVIAADSGLDQAAILGIEPDIVVGDMDSVDPEALAAAEARGAAIERHPADKDATDLELALDRALAEGCAAATVVGGYGGRIDHLLGNALVLTSSRYATIELQWRIGTVTIAVVRPGYPAVFEGAPGDRVSLLATSGPAGGVATTGLRWALSGDTLATGSTRGVSNELTEAVATVEVGTGVLLAIHERIQP